MSSQVDRLPFQHRCIVFSQHGGRGFPPYLCSISAAPWPDLASPLPSGTALSGACQDMLESQAVAAPLAGMCQSSLPVHRC